MNRPGLGERKSHDVASGYVDLHIVAPDGRSVRRAVLRAAAVARLQRLLPEPLLRSCQATLRSLSHGTACLTEQPRCRYRLEGGKPQSF